MIDAKFLCLPLLASTLFGCAVTSNISPKAGAAAPVPEASAAVASIDRAEAEGIIFERQQVMEQLEQDSERLGLIVAGLAPRKELGPTARAVANGAVDAKASFAQHVPGGRSKPEVWSNSADYMARMGDFVRRSEAMAKMAEADNMNGVIETINDAMPCKACHDIYRAQRRP